MDSKPAEVKTAVRTVPEELFSIAEDLFAVAREKPDNMTPERVFALGVACGAVLRARSELLGRGD